MYESTDRLNELALLHVAHTIRAIENEEMHVMFFLFSLKWSMDSSCTVASMTATVETYQPKSFKN